MQTKEHPNLRLWREVNNMLQAMQRPEANFSEISEFFSCNKHPADIAWEIVKARCTKRAATSRITF